MRVVALRSFEHRPTRTFVRKGQVFDTSNTVVSDTPAEWWRADVEQATAAPGERRTVKRRKADG